MLQKIEIYNKICHFFQKLILSELFLTMIINKIKVFNKRNKAYAIIAFEFSKFYTKIPYKKLLKLCLS